MLHEPPKLITLKAIAKLLSVSPRTVYRLKDSGGMPRPMRIMGTLRWSQAEIEKWVADGCPRTNAK